MNVVPPLAVVFLALVAVTPDAGVCEILPAPFEGERCGVTKDVLRTHLAQIRKKLRSCSEPMRPYRSVTLRLLVENGKVGSASVLVPQDISATARECVTRAAIGSEVGPPSSRFAVTYPFSHAFSGN